MKCFNSGSFDCESCTYRMKCFNCGFFDVECECCTCPSQDIWYACPLEPEPKIEDFMTDPKIEDFMTDAFI